MFGGKSAAPKKRKAVWEESAETDRNLELSHGSGGGLKVTVGVLSLEMPAHVLYWVKHSFRKYSFGVVCFIILMLKQVPFPFRVRGVMRKRYLQPMA